METKIELADFWVSSSLRFQELTATSHEKHVIFFCSAVYVGYEMYEIDAFGTERLKKGEMDSRTDTNN